MADEATRAELEPQEEFQPVVMKLDPIERDEIKIFAGLGAYIVPIVIVHVALIYAVLRAATGFSLPRWLYTWPVVTWLAVNGAAIGYGAWLWRKNRYSPDGRRWVIGRGARTAIVVWLAVSLFLYLLPTVLGDAWRALRSALSGW